jgi:membrane protease YdiL (CAAX protease family)
MDAAKKADLRRILIFLVFTFTLAYAWTIFLIWPRALGKDAGALTHEETAVNTLLTAVLMFFPAMGVLFTRLVTREGFKNSMLRPNLKGNVKYYLAACFAPLVLTLIGTVAYYICFPSDFSLAEFRGTDITKIGMMLVTTVLIILSPFLNFVPALGEEWGWRGYLLPKVAQRMSFLPAAVLTGFIWGIWHAPIIVSGHNYGINYYGYPWLGIVAMCIFCIVAGILLSYLTLSTKSCLPAALAHGAMNGTAALGMLFYNYPTYLETPSFELVNRFVGPLPTGIIGGIAYIAVAVWIVVKVCKERN